MRWRTWTGAEILCGVVLWLLPLASVADAAAQTTYTVAGRVVSAEDMQPIQRATIELLSPDGEHTVDSTTADELGRFSFKAVAQGTYVLRGEAAGFTASRYRQHGNFSSAIVAGGAVPADSLTLKLQPLGRISGTITDEDAEPIRNATVHIFRRDNVTGDEAIVPAAQLQTDDLGHYESARLPPGTYFVAVAASPWYGVHPAPNAQQGAGFGVVPYQDPSLDVAYPVTYYPVGSDPARAEPIAIDGNEARADLQLSPVPSLSLTFPYTPGGRGTSRVPQVQAMIFGRAFSTPATRIVQSKDSMALTGLAPGDYAVRSNAQFPGDNGRGGASGGGAGHVSLTADGPNTVSLTRDPLARLRCRAQSADGGPLPPSLQIRLLPADASGGNPGASGPARHGELEAELEAEPGDYYIALAGSSKNFVRSVAVNGKALPSNDLHLNAGDSLSCTVVVSEGTHTLRGTAQAAGAPVSGAMLLLIPADQHLVLRRWYQQESDLDGSFEIPSVPPGPYLLLALDEAAWSARWRSPDFLSAHLPHATPLLVPETPPAEIVLREPVAVDPL